ncbi:Methylcrotonoyl-CoA carboxylase subunit alpha, mitochondrial -like protein [Gossypium arboreum]|uniref:Methylcrotonoyl-CoA carboxylase subunit alpha, mitochondrial-like protein n=1 Tax=Gossypium arboreum TaxID=29729 RepID=A0A0B0MIM3_GOSAR|nr:Methylcrotonoyl-CoA carboxylase subunit alpha, mitochondrial -like protein [Gossypium arboreum]
MSLMRSKKAITGIPLTIDVLTSPSCKTRSHSFLVRYLSGEVSPPPKSLSLKDIIDC